MIAASLLPPLVALAFISIWRLVSLLVLFLRTKREDRQPTKSSREVAKELLEKARLEFEDEQAMRNLPPVTMNWPIKVRYEDL